MTIKSMFYLPGMFFTSGLNDVLWQPENIIDRCADAGIKWVAQEIGDPHTQPSDELITRMRSGCHNRGLHWGIWEPIPKSLDNLEKYKPNFWILNVETDHSDYTALLNSFRSKHPLLPCGVVTDLGLDPKPFIRHNVKCMPECYLQEPDPQNHSPKSMVAYAKWLGWKLVFPCLGVYHSFPLSSYPARGIPGDGYSIYMTEGMQDSDWLTLNFWNRG